MHRSTIYYFSLALAVLAALAASHQSLLAQGEDNRTRSATMQVGLHAGGILALPSADFEQFPGVATCMGMQQTTRFEHGSGGGFAISGALALAPQIGSTLGSHFGSTMNVGVALTSTTFEADEVIGYASDAGGTSVPIVSRYSLAVRLQELRIEPSATYWVSSSVPAMLSLGVRLGYQFGGAYTYNERLVSPSGATFGDGAVERNGNEGDVTTLRTINFGLLAGIGYDVPISSSWALRPNLSGMIGFGSPVKGVTWGAAEVRLGVGLFYSLPREDSSPLQEQR